MSDLAFAKSLRALRRLEHLCSRFRPFVQCRTKELNLKQLALACILERQSRLGGAERDRTVDPLLAKQVLSQLSYSPIDRYFKPKVLALSTR